MRRGSFDQPILGKETKIMRNRYETRVMRQTLLPRTSKLLTLILCFLVAASLGGNAAARADSGDFCDATAACWHFWYQTPQTNLSATDPCTRLSKAIVGARTSQEYLPQRLPHVASESFYLQLDVAKLHAGDCADPTIQVSIAFPEGVRPDNQSQPIRCYSNNDRRTFQPLPCNSLMLLNDSTSYKFLVPVIASHALDWSTRANWTIHALFPTVGSETWNVDAQVFLPADDDPVNALWVAAGGPANLGLPKAVESHVLSPTRVRSTYWALVNGAVITHLPSMGAHLLGSDFAQHWNDQCWGPARDDAAIVAPNVWQQDFLGGYIKHDLAHGTWEAHTPFCGAGAIDR